VTAPVTPAPPTETPTDPDAPDTSAHQTRHVTRLELAEELIAVYDLLNEAFWLAASRLKSGGVDMVDQHDFWSAFRGLDEILDGGLSGFAIDGTRPTYEYNPFMGRADELRSIRKDS
jgi:hypothetical protein